ncbi:MAG: hypothetical protein Ta2A_08550 [Treponemataceae bacterium]|nr:MAG: hypothetical protein Ta2A_08550 [Treponemataceae bacterium]
MNIVLREWDSKSILESKAQCDNWIMLDTHAQSPRKFYSFELTADNGKISNVAFLSDDTGITPSAVFFNRNKYFVVQHDTRVSFVEYSSLQLITFYEFCSAGYELIILAKNNTLLCIHEIGVVCFNSNCQKIWEHSFNKIITFWTKCAEDKLVVKYEDGHKNILNLITGIMQ